MNDTLNKAINFAVKNPMYIDYAEIYLELKHTLRDFHEATLKKDWDTAFVLSNNLVELSHELETAAERLLNDQK
jgi:hypothetical protein